MYVNEAKQHVVPLAALTPETDPNCFIQVVVTLLWPYSPSNLTFRLSVSEEDFRLRRNRGQLRLDFRDACAKELGARNVQIGDKILLSLKGGDFRPLKSTTSRDVPWILKFDRKLHLKLRNEDNWVSIDEPESPTEHSPIPSSNEPLSPISSIPVTTKDVQLEWSTPTVLKRCRRGRSLDRSEDTYFGNLFDEEDLEPEHLSKRPRFTTSSYRLISRTPSPVTNTARKGREDQEAVVPEIMEDSRERMDEAEKVDSHSPEAEEARELNEQDVLMDESQFAQGPTFSQACRNFTATLRLHLPNDHILDTVIREIIQIEEEVNGTPFESQNNSIQQKIDACMFAMKSHSELLERKEFSDSAEILEIFSRLREELVIPAQTQENNSSVQIADQAVDVESRSNDVDMSPPEVPSLRILTSQNSDEIPDSPNLGPVLSPSLPAVSPLPGRDLYLWDDLNAREESGEADTSLLDKLLNSLDSNCASSGLSRAPEELVSSAAEKTLHTVRLSQEHGKTERETKAMAESTQLEAEVVSVTAPLRTPRSPELQLEHSESGDNHEAIPSGDNNSVSGKALYKPPSRHMYDEDSVTTIGTPSESDTTGQIKESKDKNTAPLLESVDRKLTTIPNKLLKEAQAGQRSDIQPKQFGSGSGVQSISVKLQAGMTTDLSDFPPLSKLRFGAKVDIIGVVARAKPIKRATRGPKDYFTSIRVIDHSLPTGLTITVFRPRPEAVIKVDVGDCVLLRDFKILTQKHQLVGLSADTSAWAVWKWAKERNGLERPAVMCGPPLEFGLQEEKYAESVGQWYWSLEETVRKDLSIWDEEERLKQKEIVEVSVGKTGCP